MTREMIVAATAAGIVWGFGGGCIGYKTGSSDGYDKGYEEGLRVEKDIYEKSKAELRGFGFCEWPQKFYASINCGALAPDYPKDK